MPESLDDEAVHRHLADQLRKRAVRRRLDLKKLANEAAIHERTLHRVLAGEQSPTVRMLCRLARVLKCNPSKLLP